MLTLLLATLALADVPKPGTVAPDFTLTDTEGNAVTLSALKGKTVVLEWFNPGCPFVVYAHDADGPLATLAAESTSESVVWLAINSGAPGKQGHGLQLNQQARVDWKLEHAVLIDEDGTTGRAYGATNTPQMFIIDATGKVAYTGALDDAPLGKKKGPPVNYVSGALAEMAEGEPVRPGQTKPYGCSVKYGS